MLSLRLLASLAAMALLTSATNSSAPTAEVCRNRTGTHEGFFFTFWKDGGTACMSLGAKGHYSTRYDLVDGRNNLVAGLGWKTGSPARSVVYRADRFEAGDNSYLTLYGWSVDPLIEYYVVDSWGAAFKPPGPGAEVLGTVESDGGTYEIYRTQRVNQPSIRGRTTFYQYWSVRTEKRDLGIPATITFANHVEAWRKLRQELGRMDYQVMATEGFGSRGGSEVTVWPE